MTFPILLSPLTLRGHVLRNRAVITSHGASESFRSAALPASRYIEYLRRRSASAGLIIAQPPFFGPGVEQPQWLIDRHGLLAEAVHIEGAKIFLQMAHLGVFARSDSDVHRPPLLGFGVTQSAAGETSHEMDDAEILKMIDGYRSVARLAATAGFDGVEVHGGHGYLIQQSLTPSFNSRADRWGADRTLFARSVIAVAREEVGPERVVGYRTTTDDLRSPDDGGIGFRLGVEYVKRILATGQVDVLNTTIGDGGPSYARAIPDYRYGDAPNIAAVARLREAAGVSIPVIGVGRIASPGAAEAALASGACDLVAMTRAHIADPDLLTKVASGQSHRVRPCVGANVCVNRKLAGFQEISCFHNPEVLREQEFVVAPLPTSRRILVIGAGPAGLKAAETAARRGHEVLVYDAAERPGGLLRYAADTAASSLVSTIDHLVSELAELGVHIVRRSVGVEELREIAPDEVILATGTRVNVAEAFPGAGEAGAVASAVALESELGRRILLYDTVGANEGGLVAEALAQRGHEVTFVTPEETAMPQGGYLHRMQLGATLYGSVYRVMVRTLIGYVEDGKVTLATPEGVEIETVPTDSIVVAVPRVPETGLVPVLNELRIPYQMAGDVVAPRLAMQAFKQGEEAGFAV